MRYLCFSPEGGRVLVAGGEHMVNGEARVWNVMTGEPLTPPMRHALHVSHACFSPDGCWVATASSDQTVRIWDSRSGNQVGATLKHPLPVWFVEFSPDRRHLLTAGRERMWRLWDVATEASSIERYQSSGYQRTFTEASWRVLTNAFASGQGFQYPDGHSLVSIAFDRDARRLITAGGDRNAQIREVPNGQPIGQPLKHDYPVWRAAFSPDGRLAATAASESNLEGPGETSIWVAATGEPAAPVINQEGASGDLVFSPDGPRLATASAVMTTESHGVQLWEIAAGRLIGTLLHHESSISRVAFSPNGRWLATGGTDSVARLWDAATLQPSGPPLRP